MPCHTLPKAIEDADHKAVLVGNPNVGKSVIFHCLTQVYVDVSNFPGTTLELYHGKFKDYTIIDTPGIYGISSFNDEERIARDVIVHADIVINVVNAASLDRDLFLTRHIIDTGKPVVVVLNMMDEAARDGLQINVDLLADQLQVPVVPASAIANKGIAELKAAIPQATVGTPLSLIGDLEADREGGPHVSRMENLLILEGDSEIAALHGCTPGGHRETLYNARRDQVDALVELIVASPSRQAGRWIRKFGDALLSPWIGFPFMLLMLYAMYEAIGVFVAGDIIGITEEVIMQGWYGEWIVSLMTDTAGLDPNGIAGQLLIGEFGLLTMTVIYVFGLLLPLVLSFYLFLAIFEDSGYLPRLAAMTDRAMLAIGLNGRAVIPMILGVGCVTMATITTRMLGSDRERRIATYLLALAIPCSAQLAVIVSLLAGVGFGYVLIYAAVLLLILGLVGKIMHRSLPGQSSALLIDIPPLRFPKPINVLRKTTIKTFHFLKEALPLFAVGSLLISILQLTGGLDALSRLLRPLTTGWLGLPAQSSTAFIMGIVRRDFGAAGLNELSMTSVQVVTSLLVITLFVPCIASILVLFKERSRNEAAVMWLSTFAISFMVGGFVHTGFDWYAHYGPLPVLGGLAGIAASFYLLWKCILNLLRLKRRGESHV